MLLILQFFSIYIYLNGSKVSINFLCKITNQFNLFTKYSSIAFTQRMRHRIMLNMLKETLINVYAFPLRYQTVALQRWDRREGGGTRQSGWLIENFYQLLRVLWAFYLYAAWLAGWLTASCMLPCFPLPSACSLPVPTRSPRAPACSLFSPSDINVAFTCDFPSAFSFLHIPLPHPYLHRCFAPASSSV